MEFNTLKEQRSQQPTQQPTSPSSEAEAAAAVATSSSSTASSSSIPPPQSSHPPRPAYPPQADPESAPVPPTAPVPSRASDEAEAMNTSHSASASAQAPQLEPLQPLIQEHNLLRATQILQGAGPSSSAAAFTPSPILRLNSIRIESATSLRPSFLATLCRPYLDPSLNAQNALRFAVLNSALYGSRVEHPLPSQPITLPSIMNLTGSIVSDLTKFDLFHNIDATLAPSLAPDATEEDVDVILSCRPKGRIFLKSSTDVGNGEGSASIQGRIRNVFGGAETLQGSVTFGTRTKQAFNLQFSAPLLANPDHTASLMAFSSERDLTAFSSAFESIKGLKAAISSNISPTVQHEFAYEASVRGLGRLLPDVSISMRKLATQPTVKSSFSHTLLRDTRDDPVLPGSGSYFKLVQELAGFGGDASHYKVETEVSFGRRWTLPDTDLFSRFRAPSKITRSGNDISSPFLDEKQTPTALESTDLTPPPPGPTLPTSTFTFRSGFLRTLASSPSLYSDRFQLGGPTCVRMFRLNGLGPKDKLDSLGGDVYWSLGMGTNFNIPKKPDWPVKLHAFLNAGQLVQIDQTTSLQNLTSSLSPLLQPSVSVGMGLVYLQGPLRVELNAGLPLAARRSDSIRKGLQLGVGISFL